MRVYELAKELGISSNDLLRFYSNNIENILREYLKKYTGSESCKKLFDDTLGLSKFSYYKSQNKLDNDDIEFARKYYPNKYKGPKVILDSKDDWSETKKLKILSKELGVECGEIISCLEEENIIKEYVKNHSIGDLIRQNFWKYSSISENAYLNKWEVNYVINYFKKNGNNKKGVVVKKEGIDTNKLYLEHFDELKECINKIEKYEETFKKNNNKAIKRVSAEFDDGDLDKLDLDDYDNKEYDYFTKREAKDECKNQIKSAIEDITNELNDKINEIEEFYRDYFDDVEDVLWDLVEDFLLLYEDMENLLLDCSDDLDLIQENEKFKDKMYEYKNVDSMNISLDDAKEDIKSIKNNWKYYWEECEYDDDGDYYCYDMEDAIDELQSDAENIIEDLLYKFESDMDLDDVLEDRMCEAFEFIGERLDKIKEDISYDDVLRELEKSNGISNKLDVIFTKDIYTKGKKEGYVAASDIYTLSFEELERIYNSVKKTLKSIKKRYDREAGKYVEKLDNVEGGNNLISKEVDRLQKKREEYRKEMKEKVMNVSYSVDMDPEQISKVLLTSNTGLINSLPVTCIGIDFIYEWKMIDYRDGFNDGYEEAKEIYDDKISELESDLHRLVDKGIVEKNEYAKVILEIIDDIILCQRKSSECDILMEVINNE